MFKLNSSNEFIDFNKGFSPLAKQLISVIQEGINIREQTTGSVGNKMQAVFKWFNPTGAQKLMKIIADHLGVKADKMHLSKYCDFGYAVNMKIGDKYGLNAAMILDRISGRPVNEYYDYLIDRYRLYKPTYEELKRISESYDAHTGKFKDVKLANGSNVAIDLYFDPYSAFFLKDTCHEKIGYMSAEEVAAIVAHECGHVVSTLLKAVDLWFVSTANNKLIGEFLKSANITDKLKYLKAVGGRSQYPDLMKKAISLCEQLKKNAYGDTSGNNAIGPLLLMIIVAACSTVYVGGELVIGAITEIFNTFVGYDPNKLSDLHNASKNVKYSEQLADSYAVRQGLGQYLNSGLTKAHSMPVFSGYDSRNSSLVWYANNLFMMYMALIQNDYYEWDEHETLMESTQYSTRFIKSS